MKHKTFISFHRHSSSHVHLLIKMWKMSLKKASRESAHMPSIHGTMCLVQFSVKWIKGEDLNKHHWRIINIWSWKMVSLKNFQFPCLLSLRMTRERREEIWPIKKCYMLCDNLSSQAYLYRIRLVNPIKIARSMWMNEWKLFMLLHDMTFATTRDMATNTKHFSFHRYTLAASTRLK